MVNPKPIVSFTADKIKGCIGDVITFTNNTNNSVTWSWSVSNGTNANNSNPLSVTFNQAGWYDVSLTVTDNNGCSNTQSVPNMIEIINQPIADFSASSYSLQSTNTSVDFSNQSINATSYNWSFGDGSANSSVVNPSHIFPDVESQKYVVTLIAYNALGCPDTIRKIIEVIEEIIYYIPNTFTPDNDEFNQSFNPVFTSGFDPFDFTMLIFNRWGEIIFETHNDKIGWDGTYNGEICQDGSYTWKIEFKTKKNDERKMIVGHVNIIR
jgi:gliding motility-associated-like protein